MSRRCEVCNYFVAVDETFQLMSFRIVSSTAEAMREIVGIKILNGRVHFRKNLRSFQSTYNCEGILVSSARTRQRKFKFVNWPAWENPAMAPVVCPLPVLITTN